MYGWMGGSLDWCIIGWVDGLIKKRATEPVKDFFKKGPWSDRAGSCNRSSVSHQSRLVKSDNYCCLGRIPYGIRPYIIWYVRHGSITHVGTVQQPPGRYKVGTVQKSIQYMIQHAPYRPVVGWWCVVLGLYPWIPCSTAVMTHKPRQPKHWRAQRIHWLHHQNM